MLAPTDMQAETIELSSDTEESEAEASRWDARCQLSCLDNPLDEACHMYQNITAAGLAARCLTAVARYLCQPPRKWSGS